MPDGTKFCTNCGAPLASSKPSFEEKKPEIKLELPNESSAPEIKLELPNEKPAQPVHEAPAPKLETTPAQQAPDPKGSASDIDLHTEPDLILPPFDVGIEPPKEEPAGVPPSAVASPRQPDAAAAYAASGTRTPAATPRDGRGKYILKRLLFFGIALVVAIGSAFLLKLAFPRSTGDIFQNVDRVLMRGEATLILILGPIIVAFIIGMLAGLAKTNSAKNVVRVISVILRAFVPMSLAYILMETFGVLTHLLPIRGDTGLGMIMPLLSLTLPLAGFLMNAAISNGHRTTFAGGIGAVAAWIADHIILIVLAEIIIEQIFAIPGIGYLTMQALMQLNISTVFVCVLLFMILTLLLKLINDIIASLAAGGDPTEQVFGVRGSTRAEGLTTGEIRKIKSGRVLLIIGIICAALVVGTAIMMAVSSTYDPAQVNPASSYLAPGQGGHLLGTDQYGRDIYALLAAGIVYTLMAALANTIVAIILGIVFGILAGFLRGAGAEVFKAIRYISGFGAPLAVMIIILYAGRGSVIPLCFLVGLYGWGGIADRLAGAIKARKAHPGEKTSLILPVLEQVVHTFCIAIIGITIMGMTGLVAASPSYPTLGTLLASSMNYMVSYPFLAVAPAFALTTMLAAFFLLHAGFSARERYLK